MYDNVIILFKHCSSSGAYMDYEKCYQLLKRVVANTGRFIDDLMLDRSPWPKRLRWLQDQADSQSRAFVKYLNKPPRLGRNPSMTICAAALTANLFFTLAAFCLTVAITAILQAGSAIHVPMANLWIGASIFAVCIVVATSFAQIHARNAARLWKKVTWKTKLKASLLFILATFSTGTLPFLI